jgi:hypothetical protein
MRTLLRNTLTKGRLKFLKYYESFKFMFCEGKILVMVCYSSDYSRDATLCPFLRIIGNADVIAGPGM